MAVETEEVEEALQPEEAEEDPAGEELAVAAFDPAAAAEEEEEEEAWEYTRQVRLTAIYLPGCRRCCCRWCATLQPAMLCSCCSCCCPRRN